MICKDTLNSFVVFSLPLQQKSETFLILKYAHENDCPWDEETCINAANIGSLACLEYAYKNGCPFDRVAVSQVVPDLHIRQWLESFDDEILT